MAPGERLPRAARLLVPKDFERVRECGRRGGVRHFSAQIAPGAGEVARLGLAVSRRVSTRAVRRNRIKRIARESFRKIRTTLPAVDILLIARTSANDEDNASLRADLEALWKRVASLSRR